jgi:hypothetical protein
LHYTYVHTSVFHPNVVEFLNLLGPTVRIPVSDLRLLLKDNIEVALAFSMSTWTSQMTTAEAWFGRIRVSLDPSKCRGKDHFMISGENKTANNWTRVSVLTYTATEGSLSVDFCDCANSDPSESKLWAPVTRILP